MTVRAGGGDRVREWAGVAAANVVSGPGDVEAGVKQMISSGRLRCQL